MRNLFAMDVTDDENPIIPADDYCRRRVADALEEKMDEHADEMIENVENATHSLPHIIGMGAFGIVGVVCFAVFDAITDEADHIPATAWLWFAAAAVAFLLLLAVSYSYRKLITARLETDEMALQAEQADAYYRLSRHELGVPEDAATIDVLGYAYTIKKGKEKPIKMANEHYNAIELDAFAEDGCLVLGDAAAVYALPLAEVTAVTRREGRIRVHCWNKEEAHNKEPYKPYRIRYDEENDVFTVRAVYVLEWGGADRELVVPDYEWERVLQPLTGLAVTATEKAVSITIE